MINLLYSLLLLCVIFGPFIVLYLFALLINTKYSKNTKRAHSIRLLIEVFVLIFAYIGFFFLRISYNIPGIDFSIIYQLPLVIFSTLIIAVQIVAFRHVAASKIIFLLIIFIATTLIYFEILVNFIYPFLPIQ